MSNVPSASASTSHPAHARFSPEPSLPDLGLDDWELAEAFAALPDPDTSTHEGKGKGKADDVEPEIQPSEREAWASWPTALDEYRVEEALSDLGKEEKKWLLFEVMLIEPDLMDDAGRGFPLTLFDDVSGSNRLRAVPGRMYHDQEVEEDGGEVWRSRMWMTVDPDEWLLTLARTDIIARDDRDSFLLNLALISFPFGQYLFQYTLDLALAKDGYVASGAEYGSIDKEKSDWMRKFRLHHKERRREVERAMWVRHPGGWEDWRITWGHDDAEKAGRGWGKSEDEMDATRAGVLANRPFPTGLDRTEGDVRKQLILFQVETIALSLLDRIKPIPKGTTFEHARITRLRILIHLCLVLTHAPMAIRLALKDVLVKARDKVREVADGMDELERDWLELDPAFAWDMQGMCRGLSSVGVEEDGVLPWSVRQLT